MLTSLCDHDADSGCWRCCALCNVDRHQCPGCGAPLEHGKGICNECEEQAAEDAYYAALNAWEAAKSKRLNG